jgi:Ribbon-helix-helix protein, copG family
MLTLTMPADDKDRAYRRRLAAEGQRQLIVALPKETVALIDELKQRRGLRSRSQVLLQLIEQGRASAQQMT